MFDRQALKLLHGPVQVLAGHLNRWGVHPDAMTGLAFGLGLAAAGAIALQHAGWGLALLLLSRLGDGLDGALARLRGPTDRGAFLDITLDFVVYAAIPLGFAIAEPAQNALAACVLLTAFFGTGASFMAFAVLAERRGLRSQAYPDKGLYYLGGLAEAGETLMCYAAMCLWPGLFAPLALGFAALCTLSFIARLAAGWHQLGDPP